MSNDLLRMNKDGFKIIKLCESMRTNAYLCPSGVPTIGWGHTKHITLGMVCTESEAENWLAQDIEYFEKVVQMKVDVPLNENQFSALVSFSFNVGATAFISSTLLRILNEGGDYDLIPSQLQRWVYGRDKMGRKVVLPGLVLRRSMESVLWSKPSE